MEQGEVSECLELLAEMYGDFSNDQMKLIAICPFFMNTFYLCGESSSDFFGRPIVELTNFQTSLLSSGRYYKNLISNSKSAPEDYYETPRKLSEWYHLQDKTQNMKDSLQDKGDGGGKSILGANKEELKALESEEEGVIDLGKLSNEKGGLSFEEILKLHGV